MTQMSKLPRVMVGDEATAFFKTFSARSSIKSILGFEVFEKRDQGLNSMFSHVCGYFAYYKPYAAKNRRAVFVQARTLKDLKQRIEDARKQEGF